MLRVIELDPHEVGQETANWTTELLAEYLDQQTDMQVTQETVRVYLHAHGYGGLAPHLDLTTQSGRASRLRGKRVRGEVLMAGASAPEPLPVRDLVEADLWSLLPADLPKLLALLPRADLYLQDEVQFAFHPTRQPGLEPQRSARPTFHRSSGRQPQGLRFWAGRLAQRVV